MPYKVKQDLSTIKHTKAQIKCRSLISFSSKFTVVSRSETRTNLIGSRSHRCRSYLTGSANMVPWSNTSVPRKLHPDRSTVFIGYRCAHHTDHNDISNNRPYITVCMPGPKIVVNWCKNCQFLLTNCQLHFEVLQVRESMFTFQKNFISSKIL